MPRIPIGLELYSVRHDLTKDPRGTLKAVAAMGYEGVEFAGPPQWSAQEYRAMLDESGLVCCGWHVPFNLVQDDQLAATIAFHKVVGNRRLVVPGIPGELRKSRADWLKLAALFNRLADKLAPHDMVTGYHNHNIEFAVLDGEQPWDTFFANTERRVIMQLDTGNAASGKGDCVAILKRYPGRAGSVHLKPYQAALLKESPAAAFRPLIGEDGLPWMRIFDLCETIGRVDWYVVEYESDAYPPLTAVAKCLEKLRAMGK